MLRNFVVPSRKDEFASPDECTAGTATASHRDALFLIRLLDGYIAFIGHL